MDEVASLRREVTVLFLDVTDFTAASHGLDSEDVFLWIDETMRLLVAVVHKYEGSIDKFTGDGLMALFGAPAAHENDPERAVRAGLEMQAIIKPLRERIKRRHGFDFQMRIGITTGQVIAGNVGGALHAEYTVLGDTVNLASRLEHAAEPGSILVSSATYQRTRPLFNYQAMPPLVVKGVPDPIQAYRPIGLLDRPGSVRGIPGLRAPMVGRAQALARVQSALAAVCKHGHSQVVLITGEAGLGKSRLVAEFRHGMQLDASDLLDVQIYQGACLAYARSTPLWVVAELLRDIVRLSELDSADLQRETLHAYLDRLGLADHDILPYLNNVLGIGQTDPEVEARLRLLDAAMLQRQTHAALRQVLLAEAAHAPTVLVFDDLHWVDPASRDFLEYLMQTTSDVPLLLILVSRESERATIVRPLIAIAEKNPERLTDIQLQALSSLEGRLLVDQLIWQSTDEAEALKRRIVERAGGNPFYTEEIIRILIDRGGLTQVAPSWQLTPEAGQLLQEVPGTLTGLILTRFDRLPSDLRQTLQQAAVIGRSFPSGLLEMLESGSAPIAAHLAELEARQFLVAEPFGSAQGYAFRHVLIQEAIYGTLLKRDRKKLHAQVARAIERAAFWPQDEQSEVLAYHYAESTSPVKAVPYLIAAAVYAARRFANETAIRHYRQALALMREQSGERHDQIFRVQIGLGQALKFVGQFAEAGQILEEALREILANSIAGDSSTFVLVDILRELADVRQREGAYDAAIMHLEDGLQALGTEAEREQPDRWRSLMDRVAWVRFRQGKLDAALALARAATVGVHAPQAEYPITLASLYNTMGGVYWQRGDLADATQYVERSLQLYKDLGYSWGMANISTNLGILYYTRGIWPKAAESFEQADSLRQANGFLPGQALNRNNLGLLRMSMGDHEQAERDFQASQALGRRLGDDYAVLLAALGLSQLALIQSRFDETAAHLAEAQDRMEAGGADEIVQAGWISALLQAEQGDLHTGLDAATQALRKARRAGLVEAEADCRRALGLLRTRAGHYAEAERLLRVSVMLCRTRKDHYRQGMALVELGRLYQQLSEGDRPARAAWKAQAIEAFLQARKLFAQLGAAYDLRGVQVALEQIRTTGEEPQALWNSPSFIYLDGQAEKEQTPDIR